MPKHTKTTSAKAQASKTTKSVYKHPSRRITVTAKPGTKPKVKRKKPEKLKATSEAEPLQAQPPVETYESASSVQPQVPVMSPKAQKIYERTMGRIQGALDHEDLKARVRNFPKYQRRKDQMRANELARRLGSPASHADKAKDFAQPVAG